jgi:hypothetical protein
MTGCRPTTISRLIARSLLFYSILLIAGHVGHLPVSMAAPPIAPHSTQENVVKPGQIGDSGYVVPIPEFKMKSFIGDKAPDNKAQRPEATNPSATGAEATGQVRKIGPRRMGPQQTASPVVPPIAPTPDKPASKTSLHKEPPPKLDKAAPSGKALSPDVAESAPILPQTPTRRRVETLRQDEPAEAVKEASADLRRAPEQKTVQPTPVPDPRSMVKSHASETPTDPYSKKVAPKSPSTPEVVVNPRAPAAAAQRRRVETLSDEQGQETVAATPEALRRSPEQKAVQSSEGAGPVAKTSDHDAQPDQDGPRLPFDPDPHKTKEAKSEQQILSGAGENEPETTKSPKAFEPLEAPRPQKQVLQPKAAFRIPVVADGLGVKSASKPERIDYQAGQNGVEAEAVPMISGRAPEASAVVKQLASSNRPAGPPQVEESAPREKTTGRIPPGRLAALPNSQSLQDVTQEDLVKGSPASRQPKSAPDPQKEHTARSSEERAVEPKPAPSAEEPVAAEPLSPDQDIAERSDEASGRPTSSKVPQDNPRNVTAEKPSGEGEAKPAEAVQEETPHKNAAAPDDPNRIQESASDKYAARRPESSQEELPERFLKAATPLAADFVHNREVRDYLKETSPILEELSLLMAKAPALAIADYDPSDPEASMFPKDIYIRMDALKRQLQILDSKTFSIIPPARFADFHSIIRESISQTSQACDAMIQYFNSRSQNNLQKVQDHLIRARQLIQLTRTAQT